MEAKATQLVVQKIVLKLSNQVKYGNIDCGNVG
jgi:hypothetical protein